MKAAWLVLAMALGACGGGSVVVSGDTGGGGDGATSSGGAGGAGATGGCSPTFECGPKNCGLVDDGCGVDLNCDSTPFDVVTCGTTFGAATGPMTCGEDHLCHCPAEGDTAEAMAFCQGTSAAPEVNTWCGDHGGCHTALCGSPSSPKTPDDCLYSGSVITPDPGDPNTWIPIWCCSPAG